MKKLTHLIIISIIFIAISCEKDNTSQRFKNLTNPVWASDSLLANGIDASGPGGILAIFNGDAKFNKDGTGTFGTYSGNWNFNNNETELVIGTSALAFPVTTDIIELTATSLKVKTVFQSPLIPIPVNLRMTFKAK